MKKKKIGRPPKPPGSSRNELLQVRLEKAEKRSFADAAAVAGQDISVWVRDRLRRNARQELEEAGLPVAFLSSHNNA